MGILETHGSGIESASGDWGETGRDCRDRQSRQACGRPWATVAGMMMEAMNNKGNIAGREAVRRQAPSDVEQTSRAGNRKQDAKDTTERRVNKVDRIPERVNGRTRF